MKKAILAVSFGTVSAEADQRCIQSIEAALQAAFPDCAVHRAFTSRTVVRKLRERGETAILAEEALDRLKADYDRVAVAPLFVIPGGEYSRLRAMADGLPVADPLLLDDDDLDHMAALLSSIAREEGRTLLLMGHGTDHAADAVYTRQKDRLPGTVHLACMEGEHTLNALLDQQELSPGDRLTLMPLMLAAGTHALEHLASDRPDSWKSVLERRGFDVRIRMQGLGALEAVQQRFVKKLASILK